MLICLLSKARRNGLYGWLNYLWTITGWMFWGNGQKKHRGKVVQQKEKTIPLSKDI